MVDEQFGRPRLKRKPPLVTQEATEQSAAEQQSGKAGDDDVLVAPQPPLPHEKPPPREARPHRRRPPRTQQGEKRTERPDGQQNRRRQPETVSQTTRTEGVKLSVVVPAYNEEENIAPLLEQFKQFFARQSYKCEMIIIDDGSTDGTAAKLKEALLQYPWLKVCTHRINRGLTAALETGFAKASGRIICFYPADLQYHANDIAKLVERIDAGAHMVTGWKQGRYGIKSVASFIYNRLSRWLFKIKVHDMNSVKAFRREVMECFTYRRGWHRYMVVMAAQAGYKIEEVPVKLYPRLKGKSKFGFWRLPAGFLDLLSVKFQLSFTTKPLLFFGSAGLISIFLGFLVGVVAIYLRVIRHAGFRPLLYLVILLVMSGLLLFFGGFLAELIVTVREEITRQRMESNKRPGQ